MHIKATNKMNMEKACRRLDAIKDLFKECEAADRGNKYGLSRESLMLGIQCKNKRTIDYNYNEHVYQKLNELLNEIENLYNHVYYAALSRGKYLKKIRCGDSNLEDLYNQRVDEEIKRLDDIFTIIRPTKGSTNTTSGDDGTNGGGNDGIPEPHIRNKKKDKPKKIQMSSNRTDTVKQNSYVVPQIVPEIPNDEDFELS